MLRNLFRRKHEEPNPKMCCIDKAMPCRHPDTIVDCTFCYNRYLDHLDFKKHREELKKKAGE